MLKTIRIEAYTLPEAWEQAVIRTWEEGAEFRTDYDKPGDPKSKDTAAQILIKNPFKEPRIHRAFPGGLEDLWIYREEVVNGVHDHWVDPEAGKWSYTYHGRLTAFPLVRVFGPDGKEKNPETDEISTKVDTFRVDRINQLEDIISELRRFGETRRAIGGLWRPGFDIHHQDPPCLNELQFKVTPDDNKLTLKILIRSNDAYKAGFMNMFAFTELQKYIAERLGIEPGEYLHDAWSFHIYGSYFSEFEGFLNLAKKRAWPDKTWTTEYAQPVFDDGRLRLLNENLDNPQLILPKEQQIRIYSELPIGYREKVDPRVKERIRNLNL